MSTIINKAWEKRYSAEWHAWKDPDVPEYFNPALVLFGKHQDTPIWEKAAAIIDGSPYSYKELFAEISRVANGLASLGLKAEDRILLFATDSVEYISTWLGAILGGVVPVAVSDMYKSENLLYFLQDTGAKALFIDEEQVDKLSAIEGELPDTLEHIVIRLQEPVEGPKRKFHHLQGVSYDQLVADRSPSFEPVLRHANDIAYMLYSGGTTGKAKGIVHLALDFILIPERQGHFWEYTENDICFATSKKYFTHGLWPGVLIPLYYGATSVLTHESITVGENLAKIIETEKPTVLVTVPTVVKNILQYVRQTSIVPDFRSLRIAITASEKVPPEIFDEFYQRFGVELLDSIGSSELTYEWIANRPHEFKRGSLGKPVFGYEVKLVDQEGAEITEPGIGGEAWVKTRTACLYYWRKLEQTKETFFGPWTRTGDILQFDEEGFFWFTSRNNDLFKVKGLWVSPIEVEARITDHPAVLEAAIIPKTSQDGLTEVKAFVVLNLGYEPSEELTATIQQRVSVIGGYKVPRTVEYVDRLPRTTLLKIDRRALIELEKSRAE